MTTEYTPSDLFGVFQKLARGNWQAIIVGGQAVNLWCSRYETLVEDLRPFFPIASRDLDFHGGIQEVKLAMKLLSATGKLNSGTDPSPNAGVLIVPMGNSESSLLIDVLSSVYGVSSSELLRTAVTWEFKKADQSVKVHVIHPVLLLESKLACLRGLPQVGRQDEKHVRLMMIVLKAWLSEQLNDPRHFFRTVERIAALMQTPDGLNAYAKGIDLWESIPFSKLSQDEAYQTFLMRRYPQLVDEIDIRRAGHAKAIED